MVYYLTHARDSALRLIKVYNNVPPLTRRYVFRLVVSQKSSMLAPVASQENLGMTKLKRVKKASFEPSGFFARNWQNNAGEGWVCCSVFGLDSVGMLV